MQIKASKINSKKNKNKKYPRVLTPILSIFLIQHMIITLTTSDKKKTKAK
jgi:hypothetical protein